MNVRNFLRSTNDLGEMERIGRQIWDANPETYNDRRQALLSKMLDEEMPNASREEKDRMLYISIYDYWMYGINLK